jgi:NADPH:quinone reductase
MPAEMMTAIAIEGGKGPVEALKPVQIPRPTPLEGQVLIAVKAAGVSGTDLIQRKGLYPAPPGAPETMGLEVAGEIVHAAGRWKIGDRVCALLSGGGYAQFAACDARHVLPIPDSLTFAQAASLPQTVFTVYVNLFEHGALAAGETVMVHGATSGVGAAAIQMAKAAGARVIATARGADKAAQAKSLGADAVVDATAQDFGEVAAAEGGVDVILDMVAGPYFAKNLDALKTGGRLVHIAANAGATVELPIIKVMMKRLIITGSTLRPRSDDEKARITTEVERVVWPWLVSGKLAGVIDRTFPLAEASAAQRHLEGGAVVGKVVLEV